MNTYKVYFEIFGKKMKTTIQAYSKSEARQKILDKMIFHKIQKQSKEDELFDSLPDVFKDMFGK